MVDDAIIEDIYDSLQGVLIPEARVPWVRNLFLPGSPCDRAYAEMLRAYEHLTARLGVAEEDADVEIIINSLLDIQQLVGYEMFRCGLEYARSLSGHTPD